MTESHQRPAMPSQPSRYGQVVSLALHFVEITLERECYCVDEDTKTLITALARCKSFPAWEKHTHFLVNPQNDLCVSETSHGWLAHRQDGSGDETLTHQRYLLPILFPTASLAQVAAQLCHPSRHPALSWKDMWAEEAADEISGPDPAFGWLGWARVLPEYSELVLTEDLRAA